MSERDRRVATLAALFAADRAAALLARLETPGKADAARLAVRLASLPRRERLGALGATLAAPRAEILARAEAAASQERVAVATALRALATGSADPRVAPVVLRLCRERIGR